MLDAGKTLLLVAILFAGPLFEAGIVEGEWRDWVRGQTAREVLSSWTGWRNLVVVSLFSLFHDTDSALSVFRDQSRKS